MSLLDAVPPGWTLRDVQRDALQQIEACWADTDVLVVRAPVGAGKSLVARTLARWVGRATICTPTNALVAQYQASFPDLPTIPLGAGCGSQAAWTVAEAPAKVLNYWSYLAHRVYEPVVVFDEAHRLVPTLQDMEAVTVWTHLVPIPAWVTTAPDLLVWAEGNRGAEGTTGRVAAGLYRKLRQDPATWEVVAGVGEYRGHSRSYIRVVPLTPRLNRPVLWPPKRVRKLVFVSATFHHEDLVDLGLDGRRVRVVDVGSPIAAADRPIVFCPTANPSRGPGYEAAVREIAGGVARLLDRHPERGLIHTTYAMAQRLRQHLGDHPRLMWHSPDTRAAQYQAWLRDPTPGLCLVGSGMTEGIDLPGDLCRWQVVTKVEWPDLGASAVAAKQAQRPDWYAWAAARSVQQAVGRSSRGPGDYSVTYILDSSFGRLYTDNRSMFAGSFQAALRYGVL